MKTEQQTTLEPDNVRTVTALKVNHLSKVFTTGQSFLSKHNQRVHAVQDISFSVKTGQTLGIVGESGCGKSTLAKMLVGLLKPSSGTIEFGDRDLTQHSSVIRQFARSIQYVFQDPISSLNPRKTIRQILEAPMIHLLNLDVDMRQKRIRELLDAVNLNPQFLDRYPHEFSGGQAQRIGIARALAAEPKVLVLDEPVSALDVSVQAQVLNLLAELKRDLNLTYLFISHDLAVVEAVSDVVAVLYFGRLVEYGPANAVFGSPKHPYTHLLAQSAPKMGYRLNRMEQELAELPDPLNPPPGCAFAQRCPSVSKACSEKVPALTDNDKSEQLVACYHPH